MRDYLALLKTRAAKPEVKQHGIKGMRWGIRRTDRQIAKDTVARQSSGEKVTPTAKAKEASSVAQAPAKPAGGEESSSARYARLAGEAKGGGAKGWSEADLKFFNARTEALSKVDKMFASNPSWLRATSKKVLQQAAQNTMQSVADGVAKKYITTPILDSIPEPKKKQ